MSTKQKNYVIEAKNVWKDFKVFHERNNSLKEMLIRGRRASYESFWALNDVSFKIAEGSTVGIIGENGSGKSTMLKVLAKILRPTKGSIHIDGKISALLELGAGFHPDLTGRENVFLNGSILGLSRKEIDARIDGIIAFSELGKFIDMPVKSYSSGMYVRLGFAVAINVDPDILLVDEILAVGDESFQRKCLNKLYDLKEQGKTIVVVSHALDQVRNICEEAIWLEHGVVRTRGKANAVVDTYLEEVNRQEEAKSEDMESIDHGARWGSGEIKITAVRLLDAADEEKRIFKTGEPLVVEMDYHAKEEISRPVFGIAVHSRDGVHITGTNTKFCDTVFDKISGRGSVRYIIESLPLLKGSYMLSTVVYDYSCLHPYDHHDRAYRLEVSSGEFSDYGVFHIPSRWDVREGAGSTVRELEKD
jgi:ABC-type polysaccharide/polyol phosphate transport system ATPase subunit